ncbi:hypothetical protein CRUP_009497 [Coryphaenoides rupestris]|nr:hypothetical protein CRUP_009497 [Coryphaenoides rupestris]
MDELVHDLVSALEESSEQAARGGFGDGGDHALAVGCLLKRQARKRRGRKRRSDNPHPPWETGHLSEGSESSGEEHKDYRACAGGGVSGANSHARDNSDSDEQLGPKRRTPLTAEPGRGKRPLWQDDMGSVLGSAEGTHSLRRRRKVKRMAVDPPSDSSTTTTAMLGPPPVPKAPHGPGCRLPGMGPAMAGGRGLAERCGQGERGGGGLAGGAKSRVKKRKLAAHRPGVEAADEGVVVESEDSVMTPMGGSKDKMELEEQKDSDEDMSDSETSSVSNSSDGGLYTNDEGRQAYLLTSSSSSSSHHHHHQRTMSRATVLRGEPGAAPGPGACGVAGVVPWWSGRRASGGAGGFHARLGRMHQTRVDLGLQHPSGPYRDRRQAKDELEEGSQPGFHARLGRMHQTRVDLGLQHPSGPYRDRRQAKDELEEGSQPAALGRPVRQRPPEKLFGKDSQQADQRPPGLPVHGRRQAEAQGGTPRLHRPHSPGTGLGPEGRGITEPIRATQRPKGAGLGFN